MRFPVTSGAVTSWGARREFPRSDHHPPTLPQNLALCVGPDISYIGIKAADSDEIVVMAEALKNTLFPEDSGAEVVGTIKGSEAYSATYEPLYFVDHANAFQMLNADFVSTDSGTGIVHMAPAYGEDDFAVCKEADIALIDGLDAEGNFLPAIADFVGRNCKEADGDIIRCSKPAANFASTIVHSHSFCERTETPLIYRAIDAGT